MSLGLVVLKGLFHFLLLLFLSVLPTGLKMRSTSFLFSTFLTIIVCPYKTLSQNKPFLHQVAFIRVSYHSNRKGTNGHERSHRYTVPSTMSM